MIKKILILILPVFLFISCATTTVSTKDALDISNSSSKIDIYIDTSKDNIGKQELIETQNKVYTSKIKELTDEAEKSAEYYIYKAKIEGIEEGYNKGTSEQKIKDQEVIDQLSKKLNELGVEINYVEKE